MVRQNMVSDEEGPLLEPLWESQGKFMSFTIFSWHL